MFQNRELAAAYLGGLIDGEGCVYFRRQGTSAVRAVTIVNTDKSIVHACQRAYDALGIYYTVGSLNCRARKDQGLKPGWRIRVHAQRGFLSIYREIPIQSEAKQRKLKQVLKSFKRPKISRLPARTAVALNPLKNRATAAAYLAAIIDGEGYVHGNKWRVQISNTDDAILSTTIACYEKLGINNYKLYNTGASAYGNYDVKQLVVCQKDLVRRIFDVVPLQCQYKLAALSGRVSD